MTKVIIYTSKNCIYCDRAKILLRKKDIQFEEIDLSSNPEMLAELVTTKFNGRKTVPQIFINDSHVGGFDDLALLEKSGMLDQMLFE